MVLSDTVNALSDPFGTRHRMRVIGNAFGRHQILRDLIARMWRVGSIPSISGTKLSIRNHRRMLVLIGSTLYPIACKGKVDVLILNHLAKNQLIGAVVICG